MTVTAMISMLLFKDTPYQMVIKTGHIPTSKIQWAAVTTNLSA
jgi:hypothetical protein